MLIQSKDFCSCLKRFNNRTAKTFLIFTMKLCPFYIPTHTSSLDRFKPTVTITGYKYRSGLEFPLLKMMEIQHLECTHF